MDFSCSRTRSSHDSRTFIFLWRNGRKEKYDFHHVTKFIALGVISILWIVVGFSLSFGDSIGFEINGEHYGIIGDPFTYPFFNHVSIYPHKTMASTIPFILFALFQMKFAVITPALITGSFAERVRFISYLLFMVLFSLFIYTPLCHMVWHPEGLLNKFFGVKDFAGGTVVHMSAGFAALAGAIVLGNRKNPHHEPSNIPYVILGTGMLWFGWFGFNAGSALSANATAAIAFGTTTIASASAMMTWIFFDRINGTKSFCSRCVYRCCCWFSGNYSGLRFCNHSGEFVYRFHFGNRF